MENLRIGLFIRTIVKGHEHDPNLDKSFNLKFLKTKKRRNLYYSKEEIRALMRASRGRTAPIKIPYRKAWREVAPGGDGSPLLTIELVSWGLRSNWNLHIIHFKLFMRMISKLLFKVKNEVGNLTSQHLKFVFDISYRLPGSNRDSFEMLEIDIGRGESHFVNKFEPDIEYFIRVIVSRILKKIRIQLPPLLGEPIELYSSDEINIFEFIPVRINEIQVHVLNNFVGGLWGSILSTFFMHLYLIKDYRDNIETFFAEIERKKLSYYYKVSKSNCFFSSLIYGRFKTMEELNEYLNNNGARKRNKHKLTSQAQKVKSLVINKINVDNIEEKINEMGIAEDFIEEVFNFLHRHGNNNSKWKKTTFIIYAIETNAAFAPFTKHIYHPLTGMERKYTVRLLIMNGSHAIPLLPNEKWSLNKYIPPDYKKEVILEHFEPLKKRKRKQENKGPISNRSTAWTFYWDLETLNNVKAYINQLSYDLSNRNERTAITKKILEKKEKYTNIGSDGRFGVVRPYSIQILPLYDGIPGYLSGKTMVEEEEEVIVFLDEEEPESITTNVIGEGLDYLVRSNLLGPKNVFLAHNSSRFDNYFLFTWILHSYSHCKEKYGWRINLRNTIFKNGIQSISFDIEDIKRRKTYELIFHDTLPFMVGSLKNLAIGAGLPVQKGEFPYEEIKTYEDVSLKRYEIIKYGKKDCTVLKALFEKRREMFIKTNGLDPLQFSSMASYVRRIIMEKFYTKTVKIATSSIEDEVDIRKYYMGGRVETHLRGYFKDTRTKDEIENNVKKGQFTHGDFTSHYPWVCSKYPMPAGLATKGNIFTYLPENFFTLTPLRMLEILEPIPIFCTEIEYKHYRGVTEQPYFGMKFNGTLTFAYNDTKRWLKALVWKEELVFIIKHRFLGMNLRFGEKCWLWEDGETWFLADFMNEYFEQKANLDREKLTLKKGDIRIQAINSEREVAKLMINNATGFWGQKLNLMKTRLISDKLGNTKRNLKRILEADEFKINEDISFMKWADFLTNPIRNIFYSMRITNLGRMEIYNLNYSCIKANIPVLYNDTDCMIGYSSFKNLDEKIIKPNDTYNKYGMKMGGLTNEMKGGKEIEAAIFFGAKIYAYMDNTGEWSMKFKGVNQNNCYGSKKLITVEEEGELKSYLFFSDNFSENYFKSKGLKYYKVTWKDLKHWAKREFDGIRFGIRRFNFGYTNGQKLDGKTSTEIIITFGNEYKKGKLLPNGKIEAWKLSEMIEYAEKKLKIPYTKINKYLKN